MDVGRAEDLQLFLLRSFKPVAQIALAYQGKTP